MSATVTREMSVVSGWPPYANNPSSMAFPTAVVSALSTAAAVLGTMSPNAPDVRGVTVTPGDEQHIARIDILPGDNGAAPDPGTLTIDSDELVANVANQVGIPTASLSVSSIVLCGDGSLGATEACDDGGITDGDGCSADCTRVESDWVCAVPGSACEQIVCGDGERAPTETCDDSNTEGGDGCASDCMSVDLGFDCGTPGEACTAICGDGLQAGDEICDDGNTDAGDGCSPSCTLELGFVCNRPNRPCAHIPAPAASGPTFTPGVGQVSAGTRVTLASPDAAYICYSTDGSGVLCGTDACAVGTKIEGDRGRTSAISSTLTMLAVGCHDLNGNSERRSARYRVLITGCPKGQEPAVDHSVCIDCPFGKHSNREDLGACDTCPDPATLPNAEKTMCVGDEACVGVRRGMGWYSLVWVVW